MEGEKPFWGVIRVIGIGSLNLQNVVSRHLTYREFLPLLQPSKEGVRIGGVEALDLVADF